MFPLLHPIHLLLAAEMAMSFFAFQCDIFTGYLTTFDMSVFLGGFDRHVSFGIKHFQSIFHLLLSLINLEIH